MIDTIITHTYGLQILLTMMTMAVLNRAAGNGLYGLKSQLRLPGKPLLYTLPFVFLLVFYWYEEWRVAAAWMFAFGFWRLFAWGRWIDLNSMPDDYNREGEEPLWYERIIESMSFGSDTAALWIRSLFVLPGMWLIDYATDETWLTFSSPIIAAALVVCYAAPKRLRDGEYIWIAELACGVVWAMLFLIDIGVTA